MSRWFASSTTTNCTMRDAHSYSFSNKSKRVAAPAYGNPNRSCGYVDVTCASCEVDCAEPRHGFASRIEDVPLTLAEMDYQLGKATKAKTTIESLQAALAELANDNALDCSHANVGRPPALTRFEHVQKPAQRWQQPTRLQPSGRRRQN